MSSDTHRELLVETDVPSSRDFATIPFLRFHPAISASRSYDAFNLASVEVHMWSVVDRGEPQARKDAHLINVRPGIALFPRF